MTLVAFLVAGCGLNVDDPYLNEPVVSLEEAPPPIAGGTLLVTRDGRRAVVADPDRDRLVIVDLTTRDVRELALDAGLEPGRLIEDGEGRVYVALRRGEGLLEVDPERVAVTARYSVCASPRGLAWESESDRLHVACADGTLATLSPARVLERSSVLSPDLRDVVVTASGLVVSRHRSAELLHVSGEGTVMSYASLPVAELTAVDEAGAPIDLHQRYEPGVAVRLVGTRAGALVLHQRARIGVEAVFEGTPRSETSYTYSNEPVTNDETGMTWRDPCRNSVVHAAATFVGSDGAPLHGAPSIRRGVVPIDVAVSEGGRVAIAFAGEPGGDYRYGPQVVELSAVDAGRDDPGGCLSSETDRRYPGQVVAVAFAGEETVAQLREPARLVVGGEVIELGGASVRDSGHDVFHLDTGGAVACASCHPEGGDDGHVWQFAATTPRRTQPLEGMVGRAPYHRAGNVPSFADLMNDLSEQMASPPLAAPALDAAERWLTRLPAPASGPVIDAAAVARGREVFERSDVRCVECHAGEQGTDHRSYELGERTWQTPPLRGVALRAPYLHDGRALDLRAAIVTSSGTTTHGHITQLSEQEVGDLEAYVLSR